MDDIVRQAMAKWPNVPHCFGWLGLDARGDWYMRDDQAQSLGAFGSGSPGSKGSRLQHAKLIEFISRNYACDATGRWFFQNGPQRVFVELQVTPHVWRVNQDASIVSNDGQPADYLSSMIDEMGWLYLQTSLGVGVVHTQDVGVAAEHIASGLWAPRMIQRSSMEHDFGFVRSPQACASGQ